MFTSTMLRMSSGAIVWAAHFAVIYGVTALACARGNARIVPWVIGLATLAWRRVLRRDHHALVSEARRFRALDGGGRRGRRDACDGLGGDRRPSSPGRADERPTHLHAFDWVIVIALVLLAVAYLRDVGRRRRVEQSVAFFTGWLVLAIALLSPLDSLAATRFWIHMVQHELLMLVAAPLLVVGDPLRALPRGTPHAVLRPLRHATPIVAALLHAIALWVLACSRALRGRHRE